MDYRILVLVFALLIGFPTDAYGQTKTYEASGSAVMGTGMSINETKQLALDDARREALQRFGSYVKSEQTVSNGRLSEEIKVISASVVRVREKSFTRTTEGETFRYRVDAVFEIDVNRFESKIEKYQSSSALEEKVDRAARIERIIQRSSGTERKAYRLQALSLLQKLDRSKAEINASQAKLSFDRKSNREFNTHRDYVLKRGHPYTYLELAKVSEPSLNGLDRDVPTVKGTYVLRHKSLEKTRGIADTLSALANGWSGTVLEDSLKTGFNVSLIGTDAAGTVQFVKPVFGFGVDYTGGFPVGRDVRDWRTAKNAESQARRIGKFSFEATTKKIYDVESVNVVITKFANSYWLSQYLDRNGFSKREGTWVNANESLTSVSDLVLTEEAFQALWLR